MGIHYDYKSTRGDKAMKKRLNVKLELNKKGKETALIKREQARNYARYKQTYHS